jgi:DNA repair protein RecO
VKHIKTNGIILGRTNFGEADRILTILTPDQGKLRLMARGVRKAKSKLAGGIELFSTSHITFIEGRGDSGLGTLISTRLIKHYGRIVGDIARVQLGYELIKLLDRATEDHPEQEYYELLEQSFAALDDSDINPDLTRTWFSAQMLRLGGHAPDLAGVQESEKYNFDFDTMAFEPNPNGRFGVNDIKFLRLLFSNNRPSALARVVSSDKLIEPARPLVDAMLQNHL